MCQNLQTKDAAITDRIGSNPKIRITAAGRHLPKRLTTSRSLSVSTFVKGKLKRFLYSYLILVKLLKALVVLHPRLPLLPPHGFVLIQPVVF